MIGRTWFADLTLGDGTPIVAEFEWEHSALISDIWLKADGGDALEPSLPIGDVERERLEALISERGDPRADDVYFDEDDR